MPDSIMEDSESLVSWSWWTPTSGTTIGSHRGTQHRGPSATRAANHIKDYIKFDRSEGTLTFHPLGGSDVTTVIRTRQKVPQDKPVYMFEVHVVSAQAATPTSRIAVGVQFNESVLNRLPGADRSSLGVHHDTGLLHSDNSDGTPFFQYGPGDTITVAINFVTDSILLYKNGLSRGAALVGLPGGGTVYPVVGFDHAEACVAVNLGHKPFRYPAVLEALKAEVRDHVLRAIDSTPPLLLDGTSKSEDDKSKDDKSRNDGRKKKSCREKADVADEKQPTEKSAAGKGALGKSGKQQAYESSAAEAAATQAASAAHTAQLRVILDHLVHASCWKSADAISKLVTQRTVPLRCAVQPEGTLETEIGGSEGKQNDTGSGGAPMELEVNELGQLPGDTVDDMRQRQAIMEHMLTGRIEQVRQSSLREI